MGPSPLRYVEASVRKSVHDFLTAERKTSNGPDLLDRLLCHVDDVELQINVVQTYHIPGTSPPRYTDDEGIWQAWPIRLPSKRGARDYRIDWPLATFATRIGSTGYDPLNRRSLWYGFDWDIRDEHESTGVTAEKLAEVRDKLCSLDYVELATARTVADSTPTYLLLAVP